MGSKRYSVSSTSTWWQCPYLYRLKYLDKLEVKPDLRPDNPLMEGTAMHEAIEKRSIDEGIDNYKANYPLLGKEHELEMFKMRELMKKAIDQIPECESYEFKLLTDNFIGYIDGLVKVDEGVYDLLDFKFTAGGPSKYKSSPQVHIYKNYYERITGNKIRDMYYVLIPKYSEKLNEDLDETTFKEKFFKWLDKHDVQFVKVEYDPQQVGWFFARTKLMEKATSYEKRYTHNCAWCDYKLYCSTNGKDTSELLIKEEKEDTQEVDLWN